MSSPSSLLDAFQDWLARGLAAASALDGSELDACTSELESLSVRLAEGADLDADTVTTVRAGVTRFRDACALARAVVDEILCAGPSGPATPTYRRDGAVARFGARPCIVKSYG